MDETSLYPFFGMIIDQLTIIIWPKHLFSLLSLPINMLLHLCSYKDAWKWRTLTNIYQNTHISFIVQPNQRYSCLLPSYPVNCILWTTFNNQWSCQPWKETKMIPTSFLLTPPTSTCQDQHKILNFIEIPLFRHWSKHAMWSLSKKKKKREKTYSSDTTLHN